MRAGLSLCAALVLCMLVAPASAAVRIDENTEYYDISGRSVEALRAQLASKGPVGADGRRFHGLTAWKISWDAGYATDAAGCRPSDHRVRLGITITLPRWSERSGASGRTGDTWDEYSAALALHEAGHRDLAVAASNAMAAALVDFPAAADCKLLARSVEKTLSTIMRGLETDSTSYDHHTGHGVTQGARL